MKVQGMGRGAVDGDLTPSPGCRIQTRRKIIRKAIVKRGRAITMDCIDPRTITTITTDHRQSIIVP